MISLACEAQDHDLCFRRTCSCYCGHPARLTEEDRARLEGRPAPTSVTDPPVPKFEVYERRRKHRVPRIGRADRKCKDCDGPIDRPGRATRCSECHETWENRPRATVPEVVLPIAEVAAKYRAGAGSVELGEEYGCSATTIVKKLRAHGVPIRVAARTNVLTVRIPVGEAIELYRAGWGLKRLGDRYECSAGTVRDRLRAAGVTIRRQGDRTIPLPVEELAAAYRAGQTCEALAREHDVSPTTIVNKLRRAGVNVDRYGRRIVALPAEELAERYRAGESTDVLAAAFGCSAQTITRRLTDHGVELRPIGNKPRGVPLRVDVPVDELVRRYRIGWSIEDLADEYDCSTGTVRSRLRAAGVEIRQPGKRSRSAA